MEKYLSFYKSSFALPYILSNVNGKATPCLHHRTGKKRQKEEKEARLLYTKKGQQIKITIYSK
jgi:hypothetical protein